MRSPLLQSALPVIKHPHPGLWYARGGYPEFDEQVGVRGIGTAVVPPLVMLAVEELKTHSWKLFEDVARACMGQEAVKSNAPPCYEVLLLALMLRHHEMGYVEYEPVKLPAPAPVS